GFALSVVSPIKQYPDFNLMTAEQLDAFLESSRLDQWERTELRKQEKKNDYYRQQIAWRDVIEAQKLARENHIYFLTNGIFILQTLKKQFDEIDDLIWHALVEEEENLSMKLFPRETKKGTALRKEGEGLLKALEKEIQSRLWDAESVKV